jgi:uncharacterized protein (TIGR00297 family)
MLSTLFSSAETSASGEVVSVSRVAVAAAVTVGFAIVAWGLRGVSRTGAIAGALISLILYLFAGPGAFIVLVSVFLMTWLATRKGYSRKLRLGTAEKGCGRTASQVLANLSVAAAAALLYAAKGDGIFILACTAALAEAATDTVSSEYGQTASQHPRLITTWKLAPAGTDGAISLSGTVAGIFAALFVNLVGASVRLITWRHIPLIIGAATFGMLFDSLLGATIERRRWINNDAVNFFSTLVAAVSAIFLARVMQ